MTKDEQLSLISQLVSGDVNAMRIIKKDISRAGGSALHQLFSDVEVQKELLVGLMTGQLTDPEIINFISHVPVALSVQDSLDIWDTNFTKLLKVLPTQPNVLCALYLLNANISSEHQLLLGKASFNIPFGYDVATKSLFEKKEKFTDVDAKLLITWKLKKVSAMNPKEKDFFIKALCSNNPHAAMVISYHLGVKTKVNQQGIDIKVNTVDPSFYDFLSEASVQEALLVGLMKGTVIVDIIPYLYRVPVSLSKETSLRIWNENFEDFLTVLPMRHSAINALYLLGTDTKIPEDRQYRLARALFGMPFQHEKLDDIVESGLAFNLPKFTNDDAKALLACGLMECASMTYSRQLMHFFLPIWDAIDADIENRRSLEFPLTIQNPLPSEIALACSRLNGFRLLLIAFFVQPESLDRTQSHWKILKSILESSGKSLSDESCKSQHRVELEKVKRLSQDRTDELDAERQKSHKELSESHDELTHLTKQEKMLVSPLPKGKEEQLDLTQMDSEIRKRLFDDAGEASSLKEQTSSSNNTVVLIGVAALVAAVGVVGYQLWNRFQNPDDPNNL